jgi:hypothetical protein
MRHIPILLFVVGLAVADPPELTGEPGGTGFGFPATDWILDTYAYSQSSSCTTIPASFTDYRVVDDFVRTSSCYVTGITNWFVTVHYTPTSLNIMCFANDDGMPGTEIFQTPHAVACSNSGYMFSSYIIYIAEMPLSQAFSPGTRWIGMHRVDGSSWYVMVGTILTGSEAFRTVAAGYSWEPCSSSIGAVDIFKIIEGSTALDRSTWGGIKNLF